MIVCHWEMTLNEIHLISKHAEIKCVTLSITKQLMLVISFIKRLSWSSLLNALSMSSSSLKNFCLVVSNNLHLGRRLILSSITLHLKNNVPTVNFNFLMSPCFDGQRMVAASTFWHMLPFSLFATHSNYGLMAYFVFIALYVRSLFPPDGCFPTCILMEDEVGLASFSLKNFTTLLQTMSNLTTQSCGRYGLWIQPDMI